MWVAKYNSLSQNPTGDLVAIVIYSNTKQDISETYTDSSPVAVKKTIFNRLNQLNLVGDFLNSNQAGPIDLATLT